MRLNKLTLSDVVRWRMCTGCGACVFACPPGTVSLEDVPGSGLRPVFEDGWEDSGQYTDICPGFHAIADMIQIDGMSSGLHNPFLGYTLEQWEG